MTGVERLDPVAATDAALAETYAVQVACRREVGGADLMRTAAEMAAWMRHPPGFQRRGYWVVAAHRGRGVARRIKLESLRRLAADRSDVTAVVTDNDVTNAAMLAVNTALGFTEVAIQTDAFLPLA